MKRNNNICRGCFCFKLKKEIQCSICKTWMCRVCEIKIQRKIYCLDCLLEDVNKTSKYKRTDKQFIFSIKDLFPFINNKKTLR